MSFEKECTKTMAFRDELGTTYEVEHKDTGIKERFTIPHELKNSKSTSNLDLVFKKFMDETVQSVQKRVERQRKKELFSERQQST